MQITNEILTKYSYTPYDEINNYERKTYVAMLEKVNYNTLDKYNLKLATIWEFYKIPKEEIKNIHPISFIMNLKRLYFLPLYVFENMSIYQVTVFTKPYLRRLPISILEGWLEKFKNEEFKREILDDMQIPYSEKMLTFEKTMKKYISDFKKEDYYISLTKPEIFYKETNLIGLKDIGRFLFSLASPSVPTAINELFTPFLVSGQNEIYYYDKVLNYLNSLYSYRNLKSIEQMMSLSEIGVFYVQTLNSQDIETLKYISFLLETDDNIPCIKFSKKTFKYFYQDVVEYIEGRLLEKLSKKK